MTTITIMPAGRAVEASEGMTLLSLMGGSADTPDHKCTDACHIFVLDGRKGLSKIGADENERLDMIVGVGSKSRLACKATVLGTEDVTIETPSFR